LIKRTPGVERMTRRIVAKATKMRDRIAEQGWVGVSSLAKELAKRFIFEVGDVEFFEWPRGASRIESDGDFCLRPIDLGLIARAAMRLAKDDESLAYLRRAGHRLQSGTNRGFGLAAGEDDIFHFCWATEFEGFELAEIRYQLKAPRPQTFVIYDCWTPAVERKKGYYARAIRMLAQRLEVEGASPWIFSAAGNVDSIRGIEKAGFVKKFTLKQQKVLGHGLPAHMLAADTMECAIPDSLFRAEPT